MSGPEDNEQDDDNRAFGEAMRDVERLGADRVDPYRKRRRPVPLGLSVGDEDDTEPAEQPIETGEFLEFRRPGIQHRLFRDLQRGVIEARATLDLHGLRVHEARPALTRFLAQSLAARRRCVRIIHGKGRRSDGRQPVLKQKTNQWLRHRDEVLAFVSAPRWDGGTGAVYVLLANQQQRAR